MTVHIDQKVLEAARDFVARAAEHFDVTHAKLYGSQARGEARPDSDVDIAVFLRGSRGDGLQTKLDLSDIAYDFLLENEIYISAFPFWESDLKSPESFSNPELLANIERDGIAL
jgi:predicted nucleotidyltransferase